MGLTGNFTPADGVWHLKSRVGGAAKPRSTEWRVPFTRFERNTNFRDFRKFHIQQAINLGADRLARRADLPIGDFPAFVIPRDSAAPPLELVSPAPENAIGPERRPCRRGGAAPRGALQSNAENRHQDAEPQLQPGAYRLRDQTRHASDGAAHAKRQKDRSHQEPDRSHFARAQAIGENHRRNRLHRLHRQREAVEQARGEPWRLWRNAG